MATQFTLSTDSLESGAGRRGGEFCLPEKETVAFSGNRKGRRIAVTQGSVWLTQAGDAEDYILAAGQSLRITRAGVVLVQPLKGDACFRWEN